MNGLLKKYPVLAYMQTTAYTCTPASALMIFHYFEPDLFPLTQQAEMELHNNTKFWEGGEGEYGNYPKVAAFALRRGYDVTLVMKDHFCPSFMPKELYDRYMDNFFTYLERDKRHPNFQLVENDFSVSDIKREIDLGKLVIVEIKYPGEVVTHNIVVRGYDGRSLKIIDPLCGYETVREDIFENKINVTYSKNYLAFSLSSPLEQVVSGRRANTGIVHTHAKVIDCFGSYAAEDIGEGEILVTQRSDPDMTPLLMRSAGIITDTGGTNCHAAIVSRELGKPCVIATRTATTMLRSGDDLILDADEGVVYRYKTLAK